jgi:hypothetical protein
MVSLYIYLNLNFRETKRDMKLVLKIAFDTITNKEIFIENPSYIPLLGELVNITPDDFLDDKKEIEALQLYSERGIWKAGFKTVTYTKDITTVLIVLEEVL